MLLSTGTDGTERCTGSAAVEAQEQVKAIEVQAGFRAMLG